MPVIVSKINQVSKFKIDNTIRYDFPTAKIRVDLDKGLIEVVLVGDELGKYSFKFVDLDNNQGTSDAEGYVDWLASNSYFFQSDIVSQGSPGQSAYQIWLAEGNAGSEQDFLDSLEGQDGLTAYQVWLAEGGVGSEADFLSSLQGQPGPQGQSGSVSALVSLTGGQGYSGQIDTIDRTMIYAESSGGQCSFTHAQDGTTPFRALIRFAHRSGGNGLLVKILDSYTITQIATVTESISASSPAGFNEFTITDQDKYYDILFDSAAATATVVESGNFNAFQAQPPPLLDLEQLTGMQLVGLNWILDDWVYDFGQITQMLDKTNEVALPVGEVTNSGTFTRAGDGLVGKIVVVGDSPTSTQAVSKLVRVTDATQAARMRCTTNDFVRYFLDGGYDAGQDDWKYGQRAVIFLLDYNQPPGIGFPHGNPAHSTYDNALAFYLQPNRMVGTGCMWIEDFSEMVDYFAAGLGPGTPDEYGRGTNDAQFKKGAGNPIYPEAEQSPFFLNYIAAGPINGQIFFQARWKTYDGSPTGLVNNWNSYQQIDQTKVYLRCMFVLGKSGPTQYNKGTGYIWNIDIEDPATVTLITNIETIDVSSIPSPNITVNDIHIDEYLENPGGVEASEIMGHGGDNHYASAYSGSDFATEALSVLHGGNISMAKLKNPAFQYFFFQNDDDFQTTALADTIDPKEVFRMMLKNYKTRIA